MSKKEKSDESVLETTAKKIGKVAATVAAAVGVEGEAAPPQARPNTPKKEKIPKLVKKNKTRLPRREKKANQKAAAKQALAQS